MHKTNFKKRFPMNYGKVDNPTFHTFTPFDDNLGKFDPKSDKRTFLGYSTMSEAYKVYNFRTLKVEESIHLNDSLVDLNLGDLKTPSKEHNFDNEPKLDEAEIFSRN
ncbi:hypothetical protein CR513_39246, partial [Mucuna pruriens]